MPRWPRLELFVVVALGVALLLPLLPRHALGGLAGRWRATLATVALVQRWPMYAPNPPRQARVLEVYALDGPGQRRTIVEAPPTLDDATAWAWTRPKTSTWHHYAMARPGQPNDTRHWYLVGLCIDEARASRAPMRVVMTRRSQTLRPPDSVARGQPALSPPRRRVLGALDCRRPDVRARVAADRARASR